MSYFIQNSNVPININLSTLEGIGVTGLTQSDVNLKLVRSGITILNGVTGDYTFAEQHNGIYRIVLGTTLTTIADTDYVLIASDLTGLALDDKLEFTLYAESVDSSYTKLKAEIDANEAILNTININTDTVESLLTDATYGLSAIKTKEDQIAAQISDTELNILADVQAIPTTPVLDNDSRLNNLANLDTTVSSRSTLTTTDLTSIKTDIILEINNNESKIDSLAIQEDTNYLSVLGEIISRDRLTEINTLTSNLSNVENNLSIEINQIPTNMLLTDDSRLDSLINLDSTVSSRSTSTQLSTTRTDILNEIISRDRLTEINTLTSNLSNVENNLSIEINQIPTNPLLDNAAVLVNIDTPISTRSSLTDQQVWSYTSRQLTGVSGVNQINVNDFMSQFIVNEDLYLNIDMVDTNTNPVTGLSYTGPASGSLDIILYKNGVKQTVSTLTVGVSGLEEGLYRVFLDKTLMDTPKVDYVLIAKDLTSNAVTYKMQFSLYDVVGLEGAYQATIIIKDFNTDLLTPDVNVYIKNNDQSLLINRGTTNSAGEYITGLGVGEYKVILKKAFNEYSVPESMTVSSSGSNTVTFWGSGFDSLTPVTSGTCLVQGYVVDMALNPIKGAKIIATETNSDRFSGINKIVKVSKQTTSDINGYWALELARASTLEPSGIKTKIEITYPGFSFQRTVLIPDATSVEFSTIA